MSHSRVKTENKSVATTQQQQTAEQKRLKDSFDTLVKVYLENKNPDATIEINFGINKKSKYQITKLEFDKLVIDLYKYGFTIDNKEGDQILYIYPESDNNVPDSEGIYVKIFGIDYIQQYCRNDSFASLKRTTGAATTVTFTEKCPTNGLTVKKKAKTVSPSLSKTLIDSEHYTKGKCVIPFTDFNFQVLYKEETVSQEQQFDNWKNTKKFFRHTNRVIMKHPDFPLNVVLSIDKTSPFTRTTGKPILTTTLADSGVFAAIETYNIKIKLDNLAVQKFTPAQLLGIIRKTIRFILCTLQNTNYPIPESEQHNIQQQYLKLLFQKTYRMAGMYINASHFIGPSTFTLLIDNIMELDEIGEEVGGIPNIRKNYAVTDKADGERKMLFINNEGNIYLLANNMLLAATGLKTNNKDQFNSLLDGEYISVDKFGKSVSLFFAFDIYFINENDVRHHPFYDSSETVTTANKKHPESRYKLLRSFVSRLGVTAKGGMIAHCDMKIDVKLFLFSEPGNPQSIFQKSKEMLALVNNEDAYPYNRDGIIYTPYDLGVGQNQLTDPIRNHKVAWTRSLKWKPPQYNTIDFYVTVKKGDGGHDAITNEYTETGEIISYKTLILRCGFNEDTDGFLDPFSDMVNGRTPATAGDYNANYKPYPFIPITPVDPNAQFACMMIGVGGDSNTTQAFKTEDGDTFEEHTIVEFRYELNNPPLWRWIPIRVRYDKTYKLKHGEKEYGNSFKTANSIWKSIHFPVTEEMISTGGNTIPKILDDQEESYYNRKVKTADTIPLRDFHNKFIKTRLISAVASILPHKASLIDFAVGKAGDLPKWTNARFGFVFGIDIDENNIKNRRDGACARYLGNKKKKITNLPLAFFIVGDVTQNIRETAAAFKTVDDQKIVQIIYGINERPHNDKTVGNGVIKLHNRAKGGFDMASCQFAIHYFFQTKDKLHGFLRNLTENVRKDGYFITTCYDGNTVFNMLAEREIEFEETYVLRKDNKKIFEITRMYKETGFADNESSIGYAIDIFQESINNTIREYLVNFNYLVELMEIYGFILCPIDDLEKMKWIGGAPTGMFSELFDKMSAMDIKFVNAQYGLASFMSPEEKVISFLNRYFIFKKVRDVSPEDIHKVSTTEYHTPLTIERAAVLQRIPNVKQFTIETQKVDFI